MRNTILQVPLLNRFGSTVLFCELTWNMGGETLGGMVAGKINLPF